MLDCCIIYLHHRADAVSWAHLNLLRQVNPYPVVALVDDSQDRLAGSFDSGRPEWGATGWTWFNADLAVFRWFRHGGIRAKRYIVFEYDAYASQPVREAYDEVWDADAAASRTECIERNPGWIFFDRIDQIAPYLRPHISSLSPLNGFLLSHRAMSTLANIPNDRIPDCHCEMRLGTLLQAFGFELTLFPPALLATNEYSRDLINFDPNRPGIYHPIKDV